MSDIIPIGPRLILTFSQTGGPSLSKREDPRVDLTAVGIGPDW